MKNEERKTQKSQKGEKIRGEKKQTTNLVIWQMHSK